MDTGTIKTQRYAKHTSFFQLENSKEHENLYEDLGIIGVISYDEDMMEEDEAVGDCSPSTPKLKRPNQDSVMRCQTPKKPRRPRRLNGESIPVPVPIPRNSRDDVLFKFCSKRRSTHNQPLMFILNLPYEVLLHIFKFLDLTSLCRCVQVCKLWRNIGTTNELWRALNFRCRDLSVTDLQRFLHNQATSICLNSTSVRNDRRNGMWGTYNYAHGNNITPIYSSVYEDSSSPMRDPFSRVYHYKVQHLDFTNADINPTTLCLILTRCNNLSNLSLENLAINHHVLGCLSNCRTLIRLNLSLCRDVTVYGLIEMLLALDKLLELNLAWCSVCKYGPEEIVSSLPHNLTHLNIAGFRDTLFDGHIAIVISRCKRLQELDISDSNHVTSHAVDMIVQGLSNSIRGINLSRCYSITPDCYLRFMNMPFLHYLDVFGVMDDVSVAALAEALPRVNISLRPFSAIARPTPSFNLQSCSRASTIWGRYVKL